MDLVKYVTENALVLIPVLYVIGSILKGTEKIKDKYIPIILLPIGIALAIAIGGASVDAVIQWILVTGATVYGNQLIKQMSKQD